MGSVVEKTTVPYGEVLKCLVACGFNESFKNKDTKIECWQMMHVSLLWVDRFKQNEMPIASD